MDAKIDRGILFNEEEHLYSYNGKTLPGVTAIVGRRVGKTFSDSAKKLPVVHCATERGSRIHQLAEDYFRFGYPVTASKDAAFIVDTIDSRYPSDRYIRIPEMLVSDKENVATAIDLVVLRPTGDAVIFDYKTGNFDREYCSWQLGFGKYLFELEGDVKVAEAYVISTKEMYVYQIRPKSEQLIKARIRAFAEQLKGVEYGKE